jgi:hypothetical protein
LTPEDFYETLGGRVPEVRWCCCAAAVVVAALLVSGCDDPAPAIRGGIEAARAAHAALLEVKLAEEIASIGDNDATDRHFTRAWCTVMQSEGESGALPSWNDFLTKQVGGDGSIADYPSALYHDLKAAYGLSQQDPKVVPTFLKACTPGVG